MPISICCAECGQNYRVRDELAGRKIRCQGCGGTVDVPAPDDVFLEDPQEADTERDWESTSSSQQRSARGRTSGRPWYLSPLFLVLAGMGLASVLLGAGVTFVVVKGFQAVAAPAKVPAGMTFDQWRATYQTTLTETGPSPQEFDPDEPLPPNVRAVTYPSGPGAMKAWMYVPPGPPRRSPALVFFHGGFAFGMEDLEACRPAMEKGFVVLCPALRGENGNPGNFELFYGEVDDGRAAVQWLAKQDEVDPQRIYAFGHSVGGGVSAVLALLDNVPVRHTGSSGGLYDHLTFLQWGELTPFSITDPQERSRRLLLGNMSHLQHPHYAYLGRQDDGFELNAAAALQEAAKLPAPVPFHLQRPPGDHFSSFEPSLRAYLQVIETNP